MLRIFPLAVLVVACGVCIAFRSASLVAQSPTSSVHGQANGVHSPLYRPQGYCEILGKYDNFPHTMFRPVRSRKVPKIKLRELSAQNAIGKVTYDYIALDGKLGPLQGTRFTGPNGISLTPNTLTEYNDILQSPFKSLVAVIPKGTPVPFSTVLVHEFGESFSLQAARPMDAKMFEAIVSAFLTQMQILSRDEWLEAYPLGTQILV